MKTLIIGAALAVAFTATPALAQGKSGKGAKGAAEDPPAQGKAAA